MVICLHYGDLLVTNSKYHISLWQINVTMLQLK